MLFDHLLNRNAEVPLELLNRSPLRILESKRALQLGKEQEDQCKERSAI
jgi:hypothetical protein